MKSELVYLELVNEFKRKLARELTSKEDDFLYWISKQHEKERKVK